MIDAKEELRAILLEDGIEVSEKELSRTFDNFVELINSLLDMAFEQHHNIDKSKD